MTDERRCDRDLPCANCKSRNKESLCAYDDSAPTAKEQRGKDQSPKDASPTSAGQTPPAAFSTKAADWGYGATGPSTMGLLRKIESAGSEGQHAQLIPTDSQPDNAAIADKYKTLIRQLPSRPLTQKLVGVYFRHLNWHYSFLEEVIFREQLEEWNSLPYASLSTPLNLPAETRVFPALLFQVVATALLILEDVEEVDEKEFESLKYAGGMTWEDLANELCESGKDLLRLFEKRHVALATVQAEFLMAAFTKYTAKVAESWHMLASAIRDAQELGMHSDNLDPRPKDQSIESVLENQWLIQVRRKMYMILAIWDMSCAMILGRPTLMSWGPGLPTRPIDAEVPLNRRNVPLVARNPEKDPPTPVTRVLWLSNMTRLMRDIQTLQDEGPFPKDFSKVDELQNKIQGLEDAEPAFLRLQNPDTQWDVGDRAVWIQDARLYFSQFHNFCMLALHRQYIFHRKKSRDVALAVCMNTLECHQNIFQDLPPMSWRNYLLFFGSFDAIVVVSSIFIMYPHENVEHRENALQHFRWTISRFETMQSRNGLARSALGVLKAILAKFVNIIDAAKLDGLGTTPSVAGAESVPASTHVGSSTTPGSASVDTALTTPGSMGEKALTDLIEGPSLADSAGAPITKITESSYPPLPAMDAPPGPDFGFPEGIDMNNLPGMFTLPTTDLVWSDLSVLDGQGAPPASFGDGMTLDPMMTDWRFGGGFGDDTVWQFLNQYQPGQA
ncbi:fungal specific transcription factor domain-containing protein [Sarocladium implicatum]|nr:fungal specific transcription factor domain-containing protein [Sarocladium implicatum]